MTWPIFLLSDIFNDASLTSLMWFDWFKELDARGDFLNPRRHDVSEWALLPLINSFFPRRPVVPRRKSSVCEIWFPLDGGLCSTFLSLYTFFFPGGLDYVDSGGSSSPLMICQVPKSFIHDRRSCRLITASNSTHQVFLVYPKILFHGSFVDDARLSRILIIRNSWSVTTYWLQINEPLVCGDILTFIPCSAVLCTVCT